MKTIMSLLIGVLVAILMTLLTAVPPLSWVYGWLARKGLRFVWCGLVAAVIGAVAAAFRVKEH